ncbi:MAG: hypothetical protein Cons2KO_27660 [Congregibacter sp.]
MSDDYQRVEPTPFDVPLQTPNLSSESPRSGLPAWLYLALGGLAVLGVVVVFLLPGWVETSSNGPSNPSAESSQPTNSGNTASPAEQKIAKTSEQEAAARSPFADAVEAKARSQAQELLGELIDVRENLSERGAEVWAENEMAAIAAKALSGDEEYRERKFDAAIASYESALQEALVLEGSIPERLAAELESTRASIEALDADAAEAAFALAEMLDPDETALDGLRDRIEALPAIKEAVQKAQVYAAEDALAEAVDTLQTAVALDPKHQYAATELSRLKDLLTEKQFSAAMSEGYAALDEGRFDAAESRFRAAGKMKTGSSEAAAALQELSLARTAAKLKSLQRRADSALEEEDFAAAIALYQEAGRIDPSLRFAREGIAFAAPRAELDKQLTAILDQPERLVDDAILREAKNSAAQTEQLGELGPKLRQKLEAVQQTLAVASQPVTVTLRSDGLTSVTVYKVKRLGVFENETLQLRPGKYTAVGTRRGYRDQRVVFTVEPNQQPSVYIACDEVI